MRAVFCTGYGNSDVLSIRDREIPVPASDEILIRVGATVTAPADIAFRKGDPFIARAFTGLAAPKKTPGDALSGTVVSIGSGFTKYKVEDDVFGSSGESFGTNADHVICYDERDFTRVDSVYDIVFDAVGKSSFAKCRRILAVNGRYLTTVPTGSIMLHALLTSVTRKKAIFMATGLRRPDLKREDLKWMSEMMENGRLRPVIDREYPLEGVVNAHRYVETGHKRGSVVIRCDLQSCKALTGN